MVVKNFANYNTSKKKHLDSATVIGGEQDHNTTIYGRNLPGRVSKERQSNFLEKPRQNSDSAVIFNVLYGDSKEN